MRPNHAYFGLTLVTVVPTYMHCGAIGSMVLVAIIGIHGNPLGFLIIVT